MYLVQQITSDAQQIQTITLSDGSNFTIQIEYKPNQSGWFIISLTSGTFTITNMRICGSPNLLYQYRNQISFGLACTIVGANEPTQQTDFSNGNANLYILTATEVAQYTSYLNGQ